MAILKISKSKVIKCSIKEDGFGDEFALRDFFANNLEELLGVRFIEKEYTILEGRIDTLGLDENNFPVIIEYKWKENDEVLAQGLFYYNWLIKNKRFFELLVSNKLGANIKVNWEQPRVTLIARSFDRYILGAVQQEKHIELITYHYYQPDILHLENVYIPTEQKASKRSNLEDNNARYSLRVHLNKTSKEMQQKFLTLREKILQLSENIEEIGTYRTGVTYRSMKSFVRFEFSSKGIRTLLRNRSYPIDKKKIVIDITSNKWGYLGLVRFQVETNVDYLFKLVKASFESTQ